MSFDDTPLGAASLAQVHKAVLHDGRTVAVKVQHPKVQAQSSKDLLLMEVSVSLPASFILSLCCPGMGAFSVELAQSGRCSEVRDESYDCNKGVPGQL